MKTNETAKPLPVKDLRGATRDPHIFFEVILGWKAWSKQREIAAAVNAALQGSGPARIAVRSGNGTGKTALAARLMLWAVRCFPEIVVVTTAPTARQVDQLLWKEARAAYHTALEPLHGTLYDGQARWELGPRRYAIGLSPEHSRPESFQGFHAARILFIVDEASGVPPAHWEAIKGSALAGNAVIFAIGNPTRLNGEFYDAFNRNPEHWKTFHISVLDTPNLTNKEPPVPGLATPEAVEVARNDWGESSALFQVRILGNFPKLGEHSLISLDWVEASQARYAVPVPPHVPGTARRPFRIGIGVDVAREGPGETVIAIMRNRRLLRLETFHGQDITRTAARIKLIRDCIYNGTPVEELPDHVLPPGTVVAPLVRPAYVNGMGGIWFPPDEDERAELVRRRNNLYGGSLQIAVDDGGVGGGVNDILKAVGIPYWPVKFGNKPEGRMAVNFAYRVDELYWVLREALREDKLDLPPDPKLTAQLTQIEWELQSDKLIRVHKRGLGDGLPSPDRADAVALAWFAQLMAERY